MAYLIKQHLFSVPILMDNRFADNHYGSIKISTLESQEQNKQRNVDAMRTDLEFNKSNRQPLERQSNKINDFVN